MVAGGKDRLSECEEDGREQADFVIILRFELFFQIGLNTWRKC